MNTTSTLLPTLITQYQQQILDRWSVLQKQGGIIDRRLAENQLAKESTRFLEELRLGSQQGDFSNIKAAE